VQALAARALLLNGELAAAQAKVADLLQRDPQDAPAHLLAAAAALAQGQPQQALAALELALSSDFAVRESPTYQVLQARALLGAGRLEEARRVLEGAMAAPGVRAPLTPGQRQRLGRRLAEPSTSERASVYLLLAQALQRLSCKADAPEAKKVRPGAGSPRAAAFPGCRAACRAPCLQQPATPPPLPARRPAPQLLSDAVREFEGSAEEVRVAVADCELAIAAGAVSWGPLAGAGARPAQRAAPPCAAGATWTWRPAAPTTTRTSCWARRCWPCRSRARRCAPSRPRWS
jgi:tetratricopeptide repeat protein 21B